MTSRAGITPLAFALALLASGAAECHDLGFDSDPLASTLSVAAKTYASGGVTVTGPLAVLKVSSFPVGAPTAS